MKEADAVHLGKDLEDYRIRTYYSVLHLKTADLFAKKASEIEVKYKGKLDLDLARELNSYSTSVILASVAFLEANINELFKDLHDGEMFLRDGISKDKERTVREFWKLGIPKTAHYSIIKKYEVALFLLKKKNFPRDGITYKDIKSLIKLRNLLTHYEPDWKILENESRDDKLYLELKGRFNTNPFFSKKDPFFPHLCLGAGCASWAVKSSVDFANIFCDLTDTIAPYYPDLNDLKSLSK